MAQKGLTLRPRLTKSIAGFYLLFLCLGMPIVNPIHAAPQSSLSLSMQNQQFSATIIRAPLQEVLTTFTSYGPIRFVIKGDVKNDKISSSFRHLSLQKSLEKLLVRYDFAVIKHHIDPVQQTSTLPYLTEVVILSRNHSETHSDSRENVIMTPSQSSSPRERVMSKSNIKSSGWLKALERGTEMNPHESLEEIEESIQAADLESLSFIKKLLEE